MFNQNRVLPSGKPKKFRAAVAAAAVVSSSLLSATVLSPAAQAEIPPMPQGYPVPGLYKPCKPGEITPDWHFGETARHYINDDSLQFTNNTNQDVKYSAKVETGTNHEIDANSKAKLPSNWNTTAKSEIGLKLSNGWVEGETFGPITLRPGESFKVEYGVVLKDFISMFTSCQKGYVVNEPGAGVIRGQAPAERYAYAYVIRPDGSVSDLAMHIPARAKGANSQPTGGTYTSVSGPSLEKVADPAKDQIVEPAIPPARDSSWPRQGDKCTPAADTAWTPLDITSVSPTFRKPGYSQDFLSWSKGDYTFTPVTDHIVGAEFNGYLNWRGNNGRLPEGWLQSVGTVQRAYMPVNTALKPIPLNSGDRVRVTYGTTMTRINYRELHCGKDGTYSLTSNYPQASAPSGFWAEAKVTAKDGSTRTVDVTPDEYRSLPVPTQSNR
ncbi:hypothetical protein [Corynebacterium auriscanis]|uniref:hypothetical protein n=1 Tax=Corynebacterium auriscanis TaxID=99807 RepID=UPI003CEE93AA